MNAPAMPGPSLPADNEATTVEAVALPPQGGIPALHVALKHQIAAFDVNRQEVNLAIKSMKAITVVDAATRAQLDTLTTAANKAMKLIDEKRKDIKRPIVDLIDGYAKDLSEPLSWAIAGAKDEINQFDQNEEVKRLAELARLAQEKADKEKLQKDEEARIAKEGEAEKERIKKEVFAGRQAAINAMPRGIERVQAQRALDAEIVGRVAQVEKDTAQALTEAQIDGSIERATLATKIEDTAATKAKGAGTRWVVSEKPEDIVFAESPRSSKPWIGSRCDRPSRTGRDRSVGSRCTKRRPWPCARNG